MQLTDKFLVANRFCARWEGEWDDDPDDPGGATKYGVCKRLLDDQSEAFLKNVLGWSKPITKSKMRTLTRAQSQLVFFRLFWQDLNLEPLPLRVGVLIHDYAVNCGSVLAIKRLQKVHNKLYPEDSIATDGKIGPISVKAFSKMDNTHDLKAMLEDRRRRYQSIADNNERLRKFLKGWLNRVNALEGYLWEI